MRGFYNRLTGALRATDALSSKKGYTSNDAIINALLLWAADRDPDDLAEDLGPHLTHFEDVWDEVLASQTTSEPPGTEPESEAEPRLGASSGASEDQPWVTGGIRQRTDGDNAQITRKNRQSREGTSRKPNQVQGNSEPVKGKGKGGGKGKASP
ncbi:hypothetical protein [Singulisphaera sp. GP187]|uniref:hypothetical protein n=1 Tax=Singulisphaera sp. GP187 TaxID=1882752 RepID=UPI0020B17458|nr:hypothetical protein [Singulisphaera sp. GP187]